MSEKPQTIHQKLLLFQRNASAIKKDAKNPHFKNTYASLPHILSEVKPILSDLGLVLLQPIEGDHVHTKIIDSESGDTVTSSITLPNGLSPQQVGSAITYYRRYLLASILSLELEDDDGNSASAQPTATAQPAATAKPQASVKGSTGTAKDEKPWLTEKQFETALGRIKNGEHDLIVQITDNFKMKKEYRAELEKAAGI